MRKNILLLALTSVLMSLCIPTCAQQPQSDSTVALKDITAEMIEKIPALGMTHDELIEFNKKLVESEYVIEIGKISKKTKATSEDYKKFSKKTYKVPEGISLKELISGLPGVEIDKDGKLITSQRKDTVDYIEFNRHWVDPNNWQLPLEVLGIEDKQPIYTSDSKVNNGTAFVKIVNKSSPHRNSNRANIEIEYYQNVSYDAIGGNSDYVDLGLSVKWSSRNVGAAGPEEMGGLYFWGETETKHGFDRTLTYKFRDGHKYNGTDGKTVLDPEDDVAHVKWGDSWRMPTTDEINELIENCTWTRASVNGQIGFLITSNKPGYTDRSIFLRYVFFGTSGDMGYWLGSFDVSSSNTGASLWVNVYDDYIRSGSCYRTWDLPVRPVCP